MKRKIINVAVLMGGVSSERDVSLNSGREVSAALQRAGYKVHDIVVNDTKINELDRYKIDVAFIALHGTFGEDGRVQRILEKRDIPYTGSGIKASKLAMDKAASKRVFALHDLASPDYIEISVGEDIKDAVKQVKLIGFPVVVKPSRDGSSVGITIANNLKELKSGIDDALKHGDHILVEKFIEGRELTVGILMNEPLPIVEIQPVACFYNYCSKYQDKTTKYITDLDIEPHIYENVQQLALEAHLALKCRDVSRVDIMLGNDGEPYILEVNTIPGMTKTSLLPKAAKSAGIEFDQLCDMLVTMAAKRRIEKKVKRRVNELAGVCV